MYTHILIIYDTIYYADKQNIPVRLALPQYEIYNAHQKCFTKTGASSQLKPLLVIMKVILQCHLPVDDNMDRGATQDQPHWQLRTMSSATAQATSLLYLVSRHWFTSWLLKPMSANCCSGGGRLGGSSPAYNEERLLK